MVTAASMCGSGVGIDIQSADHAHTFVLQTADASGDGGSIPYSTALCILKDVEMPDHAVSEVEHTRGLDGTQHADWSDIRASWTYESCRGLNMVLTDL